MSTPDDEITKMKQVLSALEDAFPRDDLGKPDYHGHRKEHAEKREDDERMAGIKDEAAKHVMLGAIGLIFAAIAAFWGLR
jgi:hypothetical protein